MAIAVIVTITVLVVALVAWRRVVSRPTTADALQGLNNAVARSRALNTPPADPARPADDSTRPQATSVRVSERSTRRCESQGSDRAQRP